MQKTVAAETERTTRLEQWVRRYNAPILGVTPSTIHHRLKKAQKLLKTTLTGGEDNAW